MVLSPVLHLRSEALESFLALWGSSICGSPAFAVPIAEQLEPAHPDLALLLAVQ